MNVSDAIKAALSDRDRDIETYIKTLDMLGSEGIRMVCYNFMPVFDWTRSELARPRSDGSSVLAYDQERIDGIDPETMLADMDSASNRNNFV